MDLDHDIDMLDVAAQEDAYYDTYDPFAGYVVPTGAGVPFDSARDGHDAHTNNLREGVA